MQAWATQFNGRTKWPKKNTKQNKIIGRAKCCAAVNRKFCCNVYNFALVYQVIFLLRLMYTFPTSKHFVAFTRFYASVSCAFRALAVDLSNLWQVQLGYIQFLGTILTSLQHKICVTNIFSLWSQFSFILLHRQLQSVKNLYLYTI